ncbi:MAG: transposase [Polyangiales bacterium]
MIETVPLARARATKAARAIDFDFVVPRPVMTAHAGAHLVVHLAWTTRGCAPILAASQDGSLAAALRGTARELACHVVAAGHTGEEVHVVVRHPPTVCVSELVSLLKAASAEAWNRKTKDRGLDWQPGYWAKSCDGDRLEATCEFVRALHPAEELAELEEVEATG